MERKSLPLSNCEIKLDGDTGRFSGYASIFGGVDSYGDTIVKGAYDYTLRKNGKPKMFYNHAAWEMPVGKWLKLSEDDTGLHVEGELTLGMTKANDLHAALKHGTLDGMSIGYALSKDDYEQLEGGGRLIKRVTRLAEVSIVNFPADSGAKVDLESVKSALDEIETIRDFERFLRDAGGLSKGLTEALVSRAKIVFAAGDPPAPKIDAKAAQELAISLRRMAKTYPASLVG